LAADFFAGLAAGALFAVRALFFVADFFDVRAAFFVDFFATFLEAFFAAFFGAAFLAAFLAVFFAAFRLAFFAALAAGALLAAFAVFLVAFFREALRRAFGAGAATATSGAVAASGVALLAASIVSFTSFIVPPVHWARAPAGRWCPCLYFRQHARSSVGAAVRITANATTGRTKMPQVRAFVIGHSPMTRLRRDD
jgi:hypothetical protein